MLAFLGVRACEIEALRIQDIVLTAGPYVDADYAARRASALIIAVNCTTAASTCFCTSMGSGPEVTAGLRHRPDRARRRRLPRRRGDACGRGARRAPGDEGDDDRRGRRGRPVARRRAHEDRRPGRRPPASTTGCSRTSTTSAGRRSPSAASRARTARSSARPASAARSSGSRDLDGADSTSLRVWDSCFTGNFGIMADGVNARPRPKDRYRQWLTHKFATWWDQFGSWGCVGCGRCITFCPAAIDIREELAAIAPATPPPPAPPPVPSIPEARQEYVPATLESIRRRDGRHPDAAAARPRPGPRQRRPRPVRDGLAAGPAARGHLRQPLPPARRPRAHDPCRRPRDGQITSLPPGAVVGIRGPVGNGWPIDVTAGRDVVIVTGGRASRRCAGSSTTCSDPRPDRRGPPLLRGADRGRHPVRGRAGGVGRARRHQRVLPLARPGGPRGPERGAGPGRSTVSAIHRAGWDGSNAVAFVCGPNG